MSDIIRGNIMGQDIIKKCLKKYEKLNREFYSLRSILGYDWAMLYFLIGGREAGKSYAVTDFFCRQWRRYKRPFTWLRTPKN